MVSMQGLGLQNPGLSVWGNIRLEEAVYILKQDTRHFAKRQITWFKREGRPLAGAEESSRMTGRPKNFSWNIYWMKLKEEYDNTWKWKPCTRNGLGISKKYWSLALRSRHLKERFEIDKRAEFNQMKVIKAMQDNRVSDIHFAATTGYGYNDLGRDTLEAVYAKAFHGEAHWYAHS